MALRADVWRNGRRRTVQVVWGNPVEVQASHRIASTGGLGARSVPTLRDRLVELHLGFI